MVAAAVAVPGRALIGTRASRPRPRPPPQGIHKIKHVVIIMQENRSFDSYFGTYPGADGIPGLAGNPGQVPCVPDPSATRAGSPGTTTPTSTPAARTWRSTRSATSTAAG